MLNSIRQSENTPSPIYQWLGQEEYTYFLQKMHDYATSLAQKHTKEVVWFCEHQPIYTTGKRGINNSLNTLNAPLITTERGGETTFHGPGQLMMYPIINLQHHHLSVREYIGILEQSCIDLLATYHIQAKRDCALPGVWLHHEKIAALGIRIRQKVTSHGIALNVCTDLKWFDNINPCGTSRKTTNMQQQGVESLLLENIAQQWYKRLMILLNNHADSRR